MLEPWTSLNKYSHSLPPLQYFQTEMQQSFNLLQCWSLFTFFHFFLLLFIDSGALSLQDGLEGS